jgi:hypothetical protein
MRNKTTAMWATIGLAIVMCTSLFVLRAQAQSGEETTYLTFNRAVELPNQSLEAGTYIFELAAPMSSSNVVRVLSRDRRKVYYMGFTNRIDRPASMNSEPGVSLGEAAIGVPPRVRAWWPAGTAGHEFRYRSR